MKKDKQGEERVTSGDTLESLESLESGKCGVMVCPELHEKPVNDRKIPSASASPNPHVNRGQQIQFFGHDQNQHPMHEIQ